MPLQNPIDLRSRVLLSLQRALLGSVTPNLRSVVCRWSETEIEIRAIYDGEPSPEEVEEMSMVETNVLADFPPSMMVQVRCSGSDGTRTTDVAADEVAVYGRWDGRR
jgi:hypothetical protein